MSSGRSILSLVGRLCLAAVLGVCAVMGSSAIAGTSIDYGDFSGDTMMFIDVTESSITNPVPLFGAPTVSDDTLLFGPDGFGSYSEDGSLDQTDAQLSMRIVAKAGGYIETIEIKESGDVSMLGLGDAAACASVKTPIFLRVDEIDGTPVVGVSTTAYVSFTPSDGDWILPDDGHVIAGSIVGLDDVWEGHLALNVKDVVEAAGYSGRATALYLTLDNRLTTAAEMGANALIMKKLASVRIIPEPTTLALLAVGAGMLLLAAIRRRRK